MKKRFKGLVAFLLAFAMIFTSMPVNVEAATAKHVFTYVGSNSLDGFYEDEEGITDNGELELPINTEDLSYDAVPGGYEITGWNVWDASFNGCGYYEKESLLKEYAGGSITVLEADVNTAYNYILLEAVIDKLVKITGVTVSDGETDDTDVNSQNAVMTITAENAVKYYVFWDTENLETAPDNYQASNEIESDSDTITLSGLACDEDYYYVVIAEDANGIFSDAVYGSFHTDKVTLEGAVSVTDYYGDTDSFVYGDNLYAEANVTTLGVDTNNNIYTWYCEGEDSPIDTDYVLLVQEQHIGKQIWCQVTNPETKGSITSEKYTIGKAVFSEYSWPKNGVVNDEYGTDTFVYEGVEGTEYEYRTRKDEAAEWSAWVTADGLVIDPYASGQGIGTIAIGNVNRAAGCVQVRPKENNVLYPTDDTILSNGAAFTAVLKDSVELTGNAVCGEILTANVTLETGLAGENPTLNYTFKRGNEVVQAASTTNTYVVGKDDIGAQITVEVTSPDATGKLTATSASVPKITNAPDMPSDVMSVASNIKTVGSIELPTNWKWADEDANALLVQGVVKDAKAVYVGTDAACYENITVTVKITREVCSHSGGTATCKQKAVCVICEEPYGELSTTHAWDEGVVTKAPTLFETGEKKYTCTLCDETKTEEMPILTAEEALAYFVERMYTESLGRPSDAEGKANWIHMLKANTHDGAGLSEEFIMGEEFAMRGLSDEEYVDVLYHTFFNREADAEGRALWIAALAEGKTRGYVLANFVNLPEFTILCAAYGIERGVMLEDGSAVKPGLCHFVKRMYTVVLSREASDDELYNDVIRLVADSSNVEEVVKSFFTSEVYVAQNKDTVSYVKDLYAVFMNREADAAGLELWVAFIDQHGMSREQVLSEFAKSAEFKMIAAGYGLQ